MAATNGPDQGIPNEDQGPVILGATLTVTIAALMTMATRLYVRLHMIRNVGWDDYVMILAMLLVSHSFIQRKCCDIQNLFAAREGYLVGIHNYKPKEIEFTRRRCRKSTLRLRIDPPLGLLCHTRTLFSLLRSSLLFQHVEGQQTPSLTMANSDSMIVPCRPDPHHP